MTKRRVSKYDDTTAVYEIRLQGAEPESLRRQFPTAEVLTTRTETVLFRRVEEPAELDAVIAQLLSFGLVLTEVHEMRMTSPAAKETRASSEEVDGR